MVVNSLTFLWFFLFVMVVYYLCQTKKEVQNVFLLACSYWFYSQVDIKMTILLVILTLVFWLLGKGRRTKGWIVDKSRCDHRHRCPILFQIPKLLCRFRCLIRISLRNPHELDGTPSGSPYRSEFLYVQVDELCARHPPWEDPSRQRI